MDYIQRSHPAYNKAILALFSGGFLTLSLLYTVQPLFPVFSREFNVTPAMASLTLSVTTGFLAIAMLFASFLSDRFGRKSIMALSLMLSSLLCMLSALSPNFAVFVFLRALLGITLAGFPAVAMAYISEEFHPKNLGVAMGIYVSGTTVGGLSGRMLSGLVTDLFSWQTAFLFIGASALLLTIWFWKALPDSRHSGIKGEKSRQAYLEPFLYNLKDSRLVLIFAIPFVLMGGFVTIYNYLTYYLTEAPYFLSAAAVSFIFVIYLVGTFSSAYMGKMSDTAGKEKMLPLSILIMLAGVFMTLHPHLAVILFGLAVLTFGFFAAHSLASNWVGELAASYKSQAASLYLLAYYLGSSVMGTSGGVIWNDFGWEGIIVMVSLLTVTGLLLVTLAIYNIRRKINKKSDPLQ